VKKLFVYILWILLSSSNTFAGPISNYAGASVGLVMPDNNSVSDLKSSSTEVAPNIETGV